MVNKVLISCFFFLFVTVTIVGCTGGNNNEKLIEENKSLLQQSYQQNNYTQVIKYADNILEMNPNSYDTLDTKEGILRKLNRSAEAIDCLEKMIQLDGGSFRGTLTRMDKAEYLSELGRYSEAYDDYNWLRYNGNFGGSGVSPTMKQIYKLRVFSGLCGAQTKLGTTTYAKCSDDCL